jgi:hypothetical protein
MADFLPTTACNSARIKDHQTVDRIIAGYYFNDHLNVGTSFDAENGMPHLFIYGYCWPDAWKLPEGQSPEDFDPYSSDAWDDSDDGFTKFLQEIAPYLLEPLTVQAVGAEKCRFPLAACEWHVRPGAKRLKIGGFRHCDPEPVAAGR